MNTLALLALFACPQDKEDVANAAKKATELKNYAFKGVSKMDGQLPMGGGGGGGGGGPTESKFSGSFDAGTALILTTDTNEYVRIGDKTVTRPRAEWRLVEEPTGDGGGRGRGFGGRGMGMFGRAPQAPHEEMKNFAAGLVGPKKTDKKETIGEAECSVYMSELTQEAARAASPWGRWIDRMGEGAETTGVARMWIDGEGNLVQYEIKATLIASVQGNDIEVSQTRTVTIFNVGHAKVEIPAGAKDAIEGKKKDY